MSRIPPPGGLWPKKLPALRTFRVRSIWLITPKKQLYNPTLRKHPVFQKPAKAMGQHPALNPSRRRHTPIPGQNQNFNLRRRPIKPLKINTPSPKYSRYGMPVEDGSPGLVFLGRFADGSGPRKLEYRSQRRNWNRRRGSESSPLVQLREVNACAAIRIKSVIDGVCQSGNPSSS